jgi:hypothetical protein
MDSPFLAQKSNQNTWLSATLDFSQVFLWFSSFSPTLCTIVSKETKPSLNKILNNAQNPPNKI